MVSGIRAVNDRNGKGWSAISPFPPMRYDLFDSLNRPITIKGIELRRFKHCYPEGGSAACHPEGGLATEGSTLPVRDSSLRCASLRMTAPPQNDSPGVLPTRCKPWLLALTTAGSSSSSSLPNISAREVSRSKTAERTAPKPWITRGCGGSSPAGGRRAGPGRGDRRRRRNRLGHDGQQVPRRAGRFVLRLVYARNSREHNNANVLTLGASLIGAGLARQIVDAFLDTECTAERHLRRAAMIDEIEKSAIEKGSTGRFAVRRTSRNE